MAEWHEVRFDPERHGLPESQDGSRELFTRAYCTGPGAPFGRVQVLLRSGFSVLCYLPGGCMRAAADAAGQFGIGTWRVYGDHPGRNGSMQNLHQSLADAVERTGGATNRQSPAVMNLDRMFLDNNQGVIQSADAQFALFSLIECTRRGPTLGLVDCAFGPLPESVEAAFAERVWLRDLPADTFPTLIPTAFAAQLCHLGHSLTAGDEWLLWSRLRWCDPARAVRLLLAAAHGLTNSLAPNASDPPLSRALDFLWEATRPLAFTSARGASPVGAGGLVGVPTDVRSFLERAVIAPFQRWQTMRGTTAAEYERALGRLPSGVVLHGPPGTGKTYLARWMADRIGLPIRVASGAELRDSRFGQTERNLVRLFQDARRAAPCVLVLDDADDLLTARSQAQGSTASADRAIVNTALQQLDGFGGRLPGVLVVLTTNLLARLDEAVRSRLPLQVRVPYPLDDAQIVELVRASAGSVGVGLGESQIRRLAEKFLSPVVQGGAEGTDAAARLHANRGFFSHRDIHHAVALLAASGSETATDDDVNRVLAYLESRAHSEPKPSPSS